jgi:hypothetical protein
MDEIEYEDAWFLFIKTQNSDTPIPVQEKTESEMTCSDMEGSVYNNSDKDVTSEDEDRPQSPSPSPRQNGHKLKRKARKVSNTHSHFFIYFVYYTFYIHRFICPKTLKAKAVS